MTNKYDKKIDQAVKSIIRIKKASPHIGIILGSGLGNFVEKVKGVIIPYTRIKGLPGSCIPGQKGILKIGNNCAVFAGRFHYYEGYDLTDIVLPVFILHRLGIKRIIITNAAGGINPEYATGDLVLIKDHINLLGANPLRGIFRSSPGEPFPDMSDAYSRELRECAKKNKVYNLKEGVYAALAGPNYETPAEVRMLRIIGADMVGMSTVPEVIAASSLSIQVLGISCIVNMATGLTEKKLSHGEVVKVGEKSGKVLSSFLFSFCNELGYQI